MVKSLVSVIIPTFNRDHLLAETLDSIIAQSYSKWECIVVDDGSLDNTKQLLEQYTIKDSRICYYQRPGDRLKGANACRNYGFEICKGTYINWFDSDDIMHEDKIRIQVEALENSNKDFCICQSLFFSEEKKNYPGEFKYSIKSNSAFNDFLQLKIKWLTQSPLWDRKFLESQDQLFDEELQAAQEWEFHCRMLYSSPNYAVIDKALVYIREHKKSITYNPGTDSRIWEYYKARLKIYRNKSLELNEESSTFLKKYLVNSFKKMVVEQNRNSLKAYKLFLFREEGISYSAKLNALLAIYSYRLFNRGNFFLEKITYVSI